MCEPLASISGLMMAYYVEEKRTWTGDGIKNKKIKKMSGDMNEQLGVAKLGTTYL
jgi:hypothetical protein